MFQKETGVAFSQSSRVLVLILSGEATQGDAIAWANPAEFLDSEIQDFWIQSPLSGYPENMEYQVFAVAEGNRVSKWILTVSFPVQESYHLLWCILYLRTKHRGNNLGNLVLPITKFNFSCRIEKKKPKPLKE